MLGARSNCVGRSYVLACASDSQVRRKPGKRRSKDERRSMIKLFVDKYRITNGGEFPSTTLTKKEVGGSFYVVREILHELKEKQSCYASTVNDSKSENQTSSSNILSLSPDISLPVSGSESQLEEESSAIEENGHESTKSNDQLNFSIAEAIVSVSNSGTPDSFEMLKMNTSIENAEDNLLDASSSSGSTSFSELITEISAGEKTERIDLFPKPVNESSESSSQSSEKMKDDGIFSLPVSGSKSQLEDGSSVIEKNGYESKNSKVQLTFSTGQASVSISNPVSPASFENQIIDTGKDDIKENLLDSGSSSSNTSFPGLMTEISACEQTERVDLFPKSVNDTSESSSQSSEKVRDQWCLKEDSLASSRDVLQVDQASAHAHDNADSMQSSTVIDKREANSSYKECSAPNCFDVDKSQTLENNHPTGGSHSQRIDVIDIVSEISHHMNSTIEDSKNFIHQEGFVGDNDGILSNVTALCETTSTDLQSYSSSNSSVAEDKIVEELAEVASLSEVVPLASSETQDLNDVAKEVPNNLSLTRHEKHIAPEISEEESSASTLSIATESTVGYTYASQTEKECIKSFESTEDTSKVSITDVYQKTSIKEDTSSASVESILEQDHMKEHQQVILDEEKIQRTVQAFYQVHLNRLALSALVIQYLENAAGYVKRDLMESQSECVMEISFSDRNKQQISKTDNQSLSSFPDGTNEKIGYQRDVVQTGNLGTDLNDSESSNRSTNKDSESPKKKQAGILETFLMFAVESFFSFFKN